MACPVPLQLWVKDPQRLNRNTAPAVRSAVSPEPKRDSNFDQAAPDGSCARLSSASPGAWRGCSIAWDGRAEHPHRPLDEEQLRYRQRKAPGALRRPAGADREVGPYFHGSVALRQAEPDGRQLTIILLVLILAVVATYVAANIIASWCWACG